VVVHGLGDGTVTFEEFRAALTSMGPVTPARRTQPLVAPVAAPQEARHVNVGEALDYYSTTHGRWVPCTVTKVSDNGNSFEIDVKPGYWMQSTADLQRLRRSELPRD